MRVAVAASILAILLGPGSACARRSAPYHFRAPLVSGVNAGRADDLEVIPARRDDPPVPATRAHPVLAPTPRATASQPAAAGGSLTRALRALVGSRKPEQSQVQFVFETLAAIGARTDPGLRTAETADDLVRAARERRAAESDSTPLLGDIAVFDQVYRSEPSSILGLVVATDARGTVEFVYLARGVVRRGFLNLSRRESKRDASGRVLNTILRQKDGRGKKGRGDLASELFSTYLRLDRLGGS